MDIISKTFKGIYWNYINKIAEFGLLFLISVATARLLGPESYGLYSIVATFIGIYLLIFSLGFNFNLNKYVPQLATQNKKLKLNYLVKHLVCFKILCSILFCIILYIYSENIAVFIGYEELSYYLKIVVIIVFFQSTAELLKYLFIGLINIKPLTIINISTRVLHLILAYFVLVRGYGIKGLLYVMLGIWVFSLFLYSIAAKKYLLSKHEKFDIKPIYKYGLIMWGGIILNFILAKQIDILLLNHFSVKINQIGFYNIAYDLSIIVGVTLTIGFSGVITSSLSAINIKSGKEGISNAWRSLLKFSLILIIPATIFTAYYSRPLIISLYSDSYISVAFAFQLFILLMLTGRIIGGGSSYTVLMVIGKERFLLLIAGLAGTINIILDVILIPLYGIYGAIIATGCSLIIISFFELMFLKRIMPIKFPFVFLGKAILISLIAITPTLFFEVSSWFSLFVAALLYLGVFSIGLIIVRPFEIREEEYLGKIPLIKILRRVWR